MKTKIIYLDFDSTLFGYKVGKAVFLNTDEEELKEVLKDAKEDGYRLIYCYPKEQYSALMLTEIDAKVADYKCVYLKDQLIVQEKNQFIKSFSQNTSVDKLHQLTLQSGVYSRFKTDSNFNNNEFEKLYSLWIKKSIVKEIADDVLVYYADDNVLGFISYKIEKGICDLALIAVDSSIRNKGIGNSLISQLENICCQNGISKIKVATQLKNNVACRFYESKGFKLSHVETIYHLWI